MKKQISALLVAATLCFSPLTMAAKDVKIGVLDVHKIMASAEEPKAIEKQLQTEFNPKIEEVKALDKKLTEDIQKLQRDKDVLSAAEKTKLEKKVQEQQQDLMKKQTQYSQESNTKQQQLMQGFINKVKKEVETYAKKNGYDMVLLSDAVPYMSDNIDITDQILKNLEKTKG